MLKNNNQAGDLNKWINNSFKVNEKELEKAKKLYEIEYEWWGDVNPFKTNDDIKKAFINGDLTEVRGDENIKPIMRLLNPDLKKWLPYLSKDAHNLLIDLGKSWREKMNKENLSKDIKLSITSLTRSSEYQKEIISSGKLAVEGSSHTKGKSFDIDGCGYYEGEEAINPRFTDNYEDVYNSRVHTILRESLKDFKEKGLLNFIPEYEGTTNQCFHVTVAPEYIDESKN